MAKTINGTAVDQGWGVNSVSIDWGKNACYVGHTVNGSTGTYYVYCLQFTTPKFSGRSTKIAFNMSLKQFVTENAKLRFALCKSTSNCKDYYFTVGEVTDATQIASHSQSFALTYDYATYLVEMETDELTPDTTYYLYIWAGSNYSLSYVNAKENHTITLTCKASGGVRIKTSTVANALHVVVINTTSGVKRHVPVIWDGSAWKRQG